MAGRHVIKWMFFFWFACVSTSRSSYPELKVQELLVNLVYDNITNNIFIGGENVLLKASASLVELKKNVTGPKLDYIDCIIDKQCPGKVTNNRNKVLLIDNKKRLLITCGSLQHGICNMRNLDTLETLTNSDKFVVSNTALPAVALITPWGNMQGTFAMYVATSWDAKYQSQDFSLIGNRPAVSTRVIDGPEIFGFAEDKIKQSFLQFEDFKYEAKYIYGFSSGGFTYFVSVQETTKSYEKKKPPKVLKTFLIRLCQRDTAYLSYIELPLECHGANGTNFNIANSSYLKKVGDGFGSHASDDVLVITFFESAKGWDGPSKYSGICMYPVKEINEAMMSNLRNCTNSVNAGEKFGLPWVHYGDQKCAEQLTVEVSSLPPLTGLKCYIHGKERVTTVLSGNVVKCATPSEKELPSISSDTGDVFVDLALFSTQSQTMFLTTKLGFYSCSAIKGCVNCAEGKYRCNWCTYLERCTSDGNADCPGEFIMPEQERTAGSKGCPRTQDPTKDPEGGKHADDKDNSALVVIILGSIVAVLSAALLILGVCFLSWRKKQRNDVRNANDARDQLDNQDGSSLSPENVARELGFSEEAEPCDMRRENQRRETDQSSRQECGYAMLTPSTVMVSGDRSYASLEESNQADCINDSSVAASPLLPHDDEHHAYDQLPTYVNIRSANYANIELDG